MAIIANCLILLFLSTALSHGTCNDIRTEASPEFSTILFFGDSILDTGNNNYIRTPLKANFYPYGQDFPGHLSTGRFSNGKLISDMVASKLGIKDTVPAFLDPNLEDKELLTGVNFASSGSGYDESTSLTTNVMPFSKQVDLFKDYIARLKGLVGEKESANIINGALVFINAGTNDWNFNFYVIPTRRLQFDVNGYQEFLQNRTKYFIKELYDLGCRTFIVNGLPPIGCLLFNIQARLKNPKELGKCLEDENSNSQLYNANLEKLLPQLQANLPGSKIIYADFYTLLFDMINSPSKYGFTETKTACCGGTEVGLSLLCDSKASRCQNTSQFFFWDYIHPSQAAYEYQTNYLEKTVFPKLLM